MSEPMIEYGDIQVRAHAAMWRRCVEILIVDKQTNSVCHNLEFTKHYPGDPMKPTFSLDLDRAQELMDELWNCGLRPTEGTGSAGALAATQRHLDDMRKLVFKEAATKPE